MQGDRHYDYDAYGNLIRERRGTGQKLVTEYRYDCQHRLIGASLPGGSTASYKYDAFGRRIEKTVDGHTTEFLWQGERMIAESGDNRYRTYIYEPGSFRPLAMLDGEGPRRATPFYYQLDHLGTPQELTDYSGEIMWSAKYRAYGNLAALDVSEIDNPLRFQGQYFDAETGLHYNRHRYYNPGTGRFLTPDPIKLAGGLNSYQYVPNPTGWVDPLGLNNCPPPEVDGQESLLKPPETAATVNEGAPKAPGPEHGKNPEFFKTETTWKASGKGTGNEYKVFQQDIDWSLEHKGVSNLDRAKDGGAPYIMKDGVPQQLQLHHSRQNGKGPLFELSRKTHLTTLKGRGREAVHPYGHSQHPEQPVDRELFKKEVPQYWKDRAAEASK
nr:RHS repeat-associated core domain-containing protein [Pseudomonas sp. Irchel 3E19]